MTSDTDGHDGRRLRRSRTLKRGVIAFNQRHSTLECTVRDVSDDGCRISSESHSRVPDTFELLIELDGLWYGCEVAWRRAPQIGIRFLGPPQRAKATRTQSVDPTLPPRKLRLQR